MTDRPILFSGPMVNAILEGRKTQTRRVLKLPKRTHTGGLIYERKDMGGWEASTIGGDGCYLDKKLTIPAIEEVCLYHQTCGAVLVPKYKVGDTLYVREAWRAMAFYDDYSPSEMSGEETIFYTADGLERSGRYRQGMHMPRWASRLTLVVTDVRVQRVQEISERDAMAEGLEHRLDWLPQYRGTLDLPWRSEFPRTAFVDLWNSINEPRGFGWDANPWLVAVTFETHQCNIDQMEGA